MLFNLVCFLWKEVLKDPSSQYVYLLIAPFHVSFKQCISLHVPASWHWPQWTEGRGIACSLSTHPFHCPADICKRPLIGMHMTSHTGTQAYKCTARRCARAHTAALCACGCYFPLTSVIWSRKWLLFLSDTHYQEENTTKSEGEEVQLFSCGYREAVHCYMISLFNAS